MANIPGEDEALEELLARVDADAFGETTQGFKALTGARLKRCFQVACAPRKVGLLWLLTVSLGAIRYVAKYLRTIVPPYDRAS